MTGVQTCALPICVKEEDVAQGVEKLKNDCTEWKQRYAQLKRDMLAIRAERLAGQSEDVIVFADDLEGEELRILMNLVLDHGKRICAAFGGDEEHGFRYVIGSRILDMRPLAKELNETFHGRGGGKPEMVQGSVQGNESEMRAWIQERLYSRRLLMFLMVIHRKLFRKELWNRQNGSCSLRLSIRLLMSMITNTVLIYIY